MQNPFDDLVSQYSTPAQQAQPTQAPPPAQSANPFDDLVAQYSKPNPPPGEKPHAGFFSNLADGLAHVPAGLATAARDTLYGAADLGRDMIPGGKGVSDLLGTALHSSPKLEHAVQAGRNFDFYKADGLNEGLADKLGVGALEYALPMKKAALAKDAAQMAISKVPGWSEKLAQFAARNPKTAKLGADMTENAAAGGLNNAIYGREDSKGGDIATGAAIGALSPLPGAVANPFIKYGAKAYAQSAIPGFTNKATEKLRELLPLDTYAKGLNDKFLSAFSKNKENWSKANSAADGLDKLAMESAPMQSITKTVPTSILDAQGNPLTRSITSMEKSAPFENSPYLDYINKFHDKMRGLEPAEKVPYLQAIKTAKYSAKIAPQSFSGAVALRQNINDAAKNYLNQDGKVINPANRQTKQFLMGLKKNLVNETLQANKSKVGNESFNDFKAKWEDANQSHQDLQEFYKSPQAATGVVKPTNQMRERYSEISPQNGNQIDESGIGKYAPSLTPTGAKGTAGINQLSKLMGDKQTARDAVKSYLFNKPLTNGANTVDAPALYARLSPAQKKSLFGNSEEGKYLESINKTRLALGREPEKTSQGMGGMHHLIGFGKLGAAGFLGSMAAGENWDEAAKHGLMLGLGGKIAQGIGAKTATRESVGRAIRIAKSNGPLSGKYLNAVIQSYENGNRGASY